MIATWGGTGSGATGRSSSARKSMSSSHSRGWPSSEQWRLNRLGVGAARNVAWLETPTIVEIPAELSGGGGARLGAGGNFNVAVTRDGGLLSWGANGNGECGGGVEDDGRRDRPRAVARPTDPKTRRSLAFQEVDAGWRHAAATTRDGIVEKEDL